MAKHTYIIQYLRQEGADILYPYSSQKACYEHNAEELGWSYDKIKRHDWTQPLLSRDGKIWMHKTPSPMSMGCYHKLIQKSLKL